MRAATVVIVLAFTLPARGAMRWVKLADSGGPPGAVGASMATEPGGTIIHFGGCTKGDCAAAGSGRLVDETWEWTGDAWRDESASVLVAPSARWGAAMSGSGSGLLLVGGENGGGPLGDTYTWQPDRTTWTKVAAPLVNGTDLDAVGWGAATTGDDGDVYLFGGDSPLDGGAATSNVWRFDGSSWKLLPTSAGSEVAPQAVDSTGLVGRAGELLSFGGYAGTAGSSSQSLRGTCGAANCTWSSGAAGPSARDSFVMALDRRRDVVVLFGGAGDGGALDDTWEWDGASWTNVATAVHPAARLHAAMAWDGVDERLVLHGGADDYDSNATVFTDTWAYEDDGHAGEPDGGSEGDAGSGSAADGGTIDRDAGSSSAANPPGGESLYSCNQAGGGFVLFLAIAIVILVRRRRGLLVVGLCLASVGARAAPREKLAFLGLKPGGGVGAADVASLSGYVQSELASLGAYEVTGHDELASLVGLEHEKQLLGCDDSGCLAELAGALGVDRAVSGNVARLGDELILNLSLIDVPHARVVARLGRRVRSPESLEPLLDVVLPMLRELAADDGHPASSTAASSTNGSITLVGALDLAPLARGESLGGYGALRAAYDLRFLELAVTLLANARPKAGVVGELDVVDPFLPGPVHPYVALGGGVVGATPLAKVGVGVRARLASIVLFAEFAGELVPAEAEVPNPLVAEAGAGLAF